MPKSFIVANQFHNSRLDKWFKKNVLNLPQSLIEKIVRSNKVKINKKKFKTSYRLQKGDVIEVFDLSKFKPSKIRTSIKYKPSLKETDKYDNYIIENNKDFLIINKPPGIAVQSGTKSFKNIIDILKDSKHFQDSKPFIVHRLDKETSGILIIAKTREYAQLFTSLFRLRKIHKTYLAITHGKINLKTNLLKDDLTTYENGKKFTQNATTYFKVIKKSENFTFVELNPITGRKHQLRKQLFNIGNPIVGDNKYFASKYNRGKKTKSNLFLHAYKIKFMINNVKYNFKANYNSEFFNFIQKNF